MTQRRRRYTAEFKREAIALYENSERSMAEVERELGMSSGLLTQWLRRAGEDGADAFPGNGRLKPQDEELRQLRKENEILRQGPRGHPDILKKAIAIFSEKKGRSTSS